MKTAVLSAVLMTAVTSFTAAAADLPAIRAQIQNGNCDAAVAQLNDGVKKGDLDAMNQLASMHLVGTCVPKDQDKAISLYEKSAAAGSPRAKAMLQRAKGGR